MSCDRKPKAASTAEPLHDHVPTTNPEFRMKLYLACLIILGALSGCATNGPVEMSTEGLGSNQIATLTPAQIPASVLINIDRKRPGNCFTNCSFYRPVRILAGKHKIEMQVMLPSPIFKQDGPWIPPEHVATAKKLRSTASSIFTTAFWLDEQELTFEAGKNYQLRYGYLSKSDHSPYIWWVVSDAGQPDGSAATAADRK